nr:hypothetical protein [Tanacetum cinerariifolium]
MYKLHLRLIWYIGLQILLRLSCVVVDRLGSFKLAHTEDAIFLTGKRIHKKDRNPQWNKKRHKVIKPERFVVYNPQLSQPVSLLLQMVFGQVVSGSPGSGKTNAQT